MSQLAQLQEILDNDELKARRYFEALKSATAEGGLSESEAISSAAAAVGFTISPEQVEREHAQMQELCEEELAGLSAGTAFTAGEYERDVHWCVASYSCWTVYHHDKEGEDQACLADYACMVAFMW